MFLVDGVNYFYIKVRRLPCPRPASSTMERHAPSEQAGGLLLCATSRDNLSPSLVLELLQRVSRVIKARRPLLLRWNAPRELCTCCAEPGRAGAGLLRSADGG